LHFWLGAETSQDEAGAAAIKTVELDDLLGDLPVQYREVQGAESKLFTDCFRGGIRILEGGVDTLFSHVKPEEYAPRLLHIVGNMKKQSVYQVPLSMDSLNCKDVFVLDLGLELIQFNGVSAAPMEKRAANQLMNSIASERNGRVKTKDTIDNLNEETQAATKFFATLGIEGAEDPANRPTELPEESNKGKLAAKMEEFYKDFVKKLYHVVDDTVTLKQEGDLDNSILAAEGDDAIIVDVGATIFLWIGKKASLQEKGEAMSTAIKMLADQSRPMETRIVRVMEGDETQEFNACF
jgi:gelsolin